MTKTQCSVCGQTHDKCVGVVIYLCPEHRHLIGALNQMSTDFNAALKALLHAYLSAIFGHTLNKALTPSENPDD